MKFDSKRIADIELSESSHPGQMKKVVFQGSDFKSGVTQVAYAELRSGETVEEHSHDSMEEVFLILDGQCEFTLNGVVHLIGKDEVIKIAPNVRHMIRIFRDTRVFYFGVSTLK